jgi:DNA primase
MDENRNQIEEIKANLDIVSVVTQYVPTLKRTGRNHMGLCPFHKEKTPSFSVNSEMGLFKCFGCGKGGDVIKFIQEAEGLEFPKALEIAAQRAGITLKTAYKENTQLKAEKQRLITANKLTAKLYQYILEQHPSAENARKYVMERKIKIEQQKEFLIGFAPQNYSALKDFLAKKGYISNKELIKWGLLAEKNGKSYDKFRDRLMFPILDHFGDVVGFSGRKINDDNLGPKYLNSPETAVYRKSNLLYGLYQAKETIRQEGFAIIVEGNIDILTSHGAAIKNIVAPLGTALTIEQLKLLKRYCEKVYFAFDTDAAGQKALLRSFELAMLAGLEAYVLKLGKYKDVDDLIVQGEDWQKVVNQPQDAVEYLMISLAQQFDITSPAQKSKYIQEALNILTMIPNNFAVEGYLQILSQRSSTSLELLNNDFKLAQKKSQQKSLQQFKNNPSEDPKTAEPAKTDNQTSSAKPLLIVELLGLLYHNPESAIEESHFQDILKMTKVKNLLALLDLDTRFAEIKSQKTKLLDECQDDSKLIDIANEIKLNSNYNIENELLFQSTISKLIKRIQLLQIKRNIAKIKQSVDDSDDHLVELTKESKKLKL